jgi:hypothetical protein
MMHTALGPCCENAIILAATSCTDEKAIIGLFRIQQQQEETI